MMPPAWLMRSMFAISIWLSGVSRGTSTSRRASLSVTSAARVIRLSASAGGDRGERVAAARADHHAVRVKRAAGDPGADVAVRVQRDRGGRVAEQRFGGQFADAQFVGQHAQPWGEATRCRWAPAVDDALRQPPRVDGPAGARDGQHDLLHGDTAVRVLASGFGSEDAQPLGGAACPSRFARSGRRSRACGRCRRCGGPRRRCRTPAPPGRPARTWPRAGRRRSEKRCDARQQLGGRSARSGGRTGPADDEVVVQQAVGVAVRQALQLVAGSPRRCGSSPARACSGCDAVLADRRGWRGSARASVGPRRGPGRARSRGWFRAGGCAAGSRPRPGCVSGPRGGSGRPGPGVRAASGPVRIALAQPELGDAQAGGDRERRVRVLGPADWSRPAPTPRAGSRCRARAAPVSPTSVRSSSRVSSARAWMNSTLGT